HGATDEFGDAAVESRMHAHDLHAALLRLTGHDHERLTYARTGAGASHTFAVLSRLADAAAGGVEGSTLRRPIDQFFEAPRLLNDLHGGLQIFRDRPEPWRQKPQQGLVHGFHLAFAHQFLKHGGSIMAWRPPSRASSLTALSRRPRRANAPGGCQKN